MYSEYESLIRTVRGKVAIGLLVVTVAPPATWLAILSFGALIGGEWDRVSTWGDVGRVVAVLTVSYTVVAQVVTLVWARVSRRWFTVEETVTLLTMGSEWRPVRRWAEWVARP